MKLKIHSDSKPSRFRLTPLTLFISALTLFVGPHAYAESTWESSPIDLMGTGVPGFSYRDSDGALIQNPTPSHSSYRWYAQQLFNEDDRDNETAAIHVDFNGDGYHSLEIWAGIGRVRSTQGFGKALRDA